MAEMAEESRRVGRLRDELVSTLEGLGVEFELNGAASPRLPGNLNVSFPGVDAEALLIGVGRSLSLSSGSACTAESLDASHVVTALGGRPGRAEEAMRISLGRTTTTDEVATAARIIAKSVVRLRRRTYRPV